ncbi:hypothetical protein [Mycoplasmopsis pulmonis]|nr:hypothetical protein [Mycoplasmopsis pulmonis]VEU68034.1 Uncharacterised protein [Mycoplasmopsis pulmonis]
MSKRVKILSIIIWLSTSIFLIIFAFIPEIKYYWFLGWFIGGFLNVVGFFISEIITTKWTINEKNSFVKTKHLVHFYIKTFILCIALILIIFINKKYSQNQSTLVGQMSSPINLFWYIASTLIIFSAIILDLIINAIKNRRKKVSNENVS